MIDDSSIEQIRRAAHGDPFSVLGLHTQADGQRWLRAFLPGAAQVTACAAAGGALAALTMRHDDGFFEGLFPADAGGDYRL